MNHSAWKDIVNRSQFDNLPLITGCIFGVLVMATLRDFVNGRELTANWMYLIEFGTPLCGFGIWIAAISGVFPVQQSQNVAVLSLLCIGTKACMATTLWYPGQTPDTVMLTLFGAGVTLLSFRHALIFQAMILGIWLLPNALELGFGATLPGILFCLAGAGAGHVILNRRIAALHNVFELKHRVETLESILPMCSGCKKTCDDNGSWVSIESYIETREEGTIISHGLCPECKEKHYGDYLRSLQLRDQQQN